MTHAKKDTASTGEIPKTRKSHPALHGKIIPFGTETGIGREQRQKGVGSKKKNRQKILVQTEIPFGVAPPFENGFFTETGKFQHYAGRCPEGCTCGTGLGIGNSKDGKDKKRKEGSAAENQ